LEKTTFRSELSNLLSKVSSTVTWYIKFRSELEKKIVEKKDVYERFEQLALRSQLYSRVVYYIYERIERRSCHKNDFMYERVEVQKPALQSCDIVNLGASSKKNVKKMFQKVTFMSELSNSLSEVSSTVA